MGILHAFGIGFGIVPHGTQKDNNVYLSQPHWSSSILHSISKAWILLVFNFKLGWGLCDGRRNWLFVVTISSCPFLVILFKIFCPD